MDILFINANILTMDNNKYIENGYVAIKDGKISYIGEVKPEGEAKEIIDAKNHLIMPGLHNIHTHLPMSAMRGYADEYDLDSWLNKMVFPVEAKHDEKTVYLSTLLGIADSIAHGTVSVKEMYFKLDEIGKAVFESGIKANISNGAISFDRAGYTFDSLNSTNETKSFFKNWHNCDNGRIKLDMSIHAEYTSFDRVWLDHAQFAKENNLLMHVHVSETLKEHVECKERNGGLTPVQVLDKHHIFDTRTTAAHCVFIEKEDMNILRARDAVIAHNPISNLKLGSGIAPLCDMLDCGVRVGIGTDGVCSNNSHDMFEEIKTAVLLQKGMTHNPAILSSCKGVELATVNGAYAQGREHESGMIKVGMDADIIMINLARPNLYPVHDIYSTIVYSMRGLDVTMNMVRGKMLYYKGEFKTIDIEKLMYEIKSYVMPKLFGK
ncbi:MAG: amidohydrolase [Clostridia bacterium]|nr:amidohydrolase [Clostridia bacterium]